MDEEYEKDSDSLSNDSNSPECMSEDEEVWDEKISALQEQIKSNPVIYEPHVQLISLLRKTGDLQKLRAAREEMHAIFPLSPDLWLDWLTDEAKLAVSDTERKLVTDLFEKAVADYMSVSVWLEYVQFAMGSMSSVDDNEHIRSLFERALTAVGIHVTHGSLIWHAYMEFEKVILCSLESLKENSPQEYDERVKQQKNKLFSIFKRQFSVPLFEMEGTYEECSELFKDNMDYSCEQVYKKAKKKLDEVRPFEEALLESEAPHLEEYKKYIEYEIKSGDPVRIQNIYERALVENCLIPDLWLQYTQYLDTQLQIQDISLSVHERAVRNCPWSVRLWINYAQALEHHDKPHDAIKGIFERALQSGFTQGEEYQQLWLAYLDCLRRKIKWKSVSENGSELEHLRNTFQRASDHIMTYFQDSDLQSSILKYWAKIEGKYCNNMSRAREMWSNILNSGHSAEAQAWMEYVHFERLYGDEKHYRKLLFKALYSVSDWPEVIGDELLTFEREEGSLETLETATKKYEAHIQRVQERRLKAAEKESLREQKEIENKRHSRAEKKAAKMAAIRGQKKSLQKSSAGSSSDEDIQLDSEGFKIPPPPRVSFVGEGRGDQTSTLSPMKHKRDDEESEFLHVIKKQKVEENKSSHGVDVPHDATKDDHSVFLSNLSYSVDEEEIKSVFSKVGNVSEIRLVKDFKGRSKGFCYVVFCSKASVADALKKDRELVHGRPMYVSPCEDRKNNPTKKPIFKFQTGLEKCKLFIKNLPFSTTQDDLELIFKEFGSLKEVRVVTYRSGKSKGLAYVEFEDEIAAKAALVKTDGSKIGDHVITVAISDPPARKPKKEFKDYSPAPSHSRHRTDPSRRGRARTQVSLLPRTIQRSQASAAASSMRDHSMIPNGSENGSSESEVKKKMSNDDFRNLLLRK